MTDCRQAVFEPRVAAASLSGHSDAAWAQRAAPHVGAAVLGGIAIDEETREAARAMVSDRDREEFLPDDPIAFVERQLGALSDTAVVPGVNVRTTSLDPLRELSRVCGNDGAIVEINAHCRQEEMCAAGAGQSLLSNPGRLARQVEAASEHGAAVSVKVRAGVPGVDLPAVAERIAAAGGDVIHVDAMDSEAVVADVVAAADLFVIANNGVRDGATTREYLAYGADAVSVGRPSDSPALLARVRRATEEWFREAPEVTE